MDSKEKICIKATFPKEGAIEEYVSVEGGFVSEGSSENYARSAIINPEKESGSATIDVEKCLSAKGEHLAAQRYLVISLKCAKKGTKIELTGADTGRGFQHKYLNHAFTLGEGREEGVLFDTIYTLRVSGYITKIHFNFYPVDNTPIELLGVVCSDELNDALRGCAREDLCLTDPGFVYSDPLKDKILRADDENESINLWFEHVTTKRIRTDRVPSGMYGYTVNMSKNEKEGCQFFVSPTSSDRTFDVKVDPFTNKDGETLPFEIFSEYYHNICTCPMPDALPPIVGSIEVKAGMSQGYFIKLTSGKDTKPGDYTSTVHIIDAESGKEVKRGAVAAHVFDITLSDKSALNTAFAIWGDRLDHSDKDSYKTYFDWFTDNRINIMDIPGGVNPGESEEYLKNPKINTVRTWDAHYKDKFDKDPEWSDKIIFYPTEADEPREDIHFKILKEQSEKIREAIPNARIIMPFERDLFLTDEGKITDKEHGTTDSIGFMSKCINLWCPLFQSSFTTRDLAFITGATYLQNEDQDEIYGDFLDRMKKETEEGDELWAYKTLAPDPAYTNFFLTSNGTDSIVTMWQCKEFDITGFLYWAVNIWKVNYWDQSHPWEMAHSWGDGMLVYHGLKFNTKLPISSLRVEGIREGIEDYEHLYMLEKAAGKEVSDKFVSMVSTSILTFTTDNDYLRNVRVLLRQTLEKELNK